MTPDEFVNQYEFVYHVCYEDNWKSIQRHGLLCASVLLTRGDFEEKNRARLERMRRPSVSAFTLDGEKVFIRDQKPTVPDENYHLALNERVYFFVGEDGKKKAENLCEVYRKKGDTQRILKIGSRKLLNAHSGEVELHPLNVGAQRNLPENWRSKWFVPLRNWHPQKKIAEMTIVGSVPEIMNMLAPDFE